MAKFVARNALLFAASALLALPTMSPASDLPAACPKPPIVLGLRLVVAPSAVAPGATTHYRIDYTNGPAIFFGAAFSIQECVSGRWVLAPFNPTVFTKQRIRQQAGRGGWYAVSVTATAAPGNYRVRKSVYDGDRWRWLYGGFSVRTIAP